MAPSYAARPRRHEHHRNAAAFASVVVLGLGFLIVSLSMALHAPWIGLFVTS
jgi:hypothetical protein